MGTICLLDIDVQGARQIKKKLPDAISIFVLPPDRKTLEWRLRHRSEDKADVIERRLVKAGAEIENYISYDYILINDKLVESIEILQAIVVSERLRRAGTASFPVRTKKPGSGRPPSTGECQGSGVTNLVVL